MDAHSALELAKRLLPTGFKAGHYLGGERDDLVFAAMTVDDGHGPVSLSVGTTGPFKPAAGPYTPETPTSTAKPTRVLADGSRIYVYPADNEKPVSGPYPARGMSVTRVWPDGSNVGTLVLNFWEDEHHPAGWKPGTVEATVPLSEAQLVAMVSDPRWQPTVPASFAAQARHDIAPFTDTSRY